MQLSRPSQSGKRPPLILAINSLAPMGTNTVLYGISKLLARLGVAILEQLLRMLKTINTGKTVSEIECALV